MVFHYLNFSISFFARKMLVRKSRLMSASTRMFSLRGGKQWSDGIHYWQLNSQTTLVLALRLLYLMTSSCTTSVTQKVSLRTYEFLSIALLILLCFLLHVWWVGANEGGTLSSQIYRCYTFPLETSSYKNFLPFQQLKRSGTRDDAIHYFIQNLSL